MSAQPRWYLPAVGKTSTATRCRVPSHGRMLAAGPPPAPPNVVALAYPDAVLEGVQACFAAQPEDCRHAAVPVDLGWPVLDLDCGRRGRGLSRRDQGERGDESHCARYCNCSDHGVTSL